MKKLKPSILILLIFVCCFQSCSSDSDEIMNEDTSNLNLTTTTVCTCAGLFETLDANLDGNISESEYETLGDSNNSFPQIDTDGNNLISLTEWSLVCDQEFICRSEPTCPNC